MASVVMSVSITAELGGHFRHFVTQGFREADVDHTGIDVRVKCAGLAHEHADDGGDTDDCAGHHRIALADEVADFLADKVGNVHQRIESVLRAFGHDGAGDVLHGHEVKRTYFCNLLSRFW